MRRLWHFWFALAATVVILQLIPVTGIFLMMLAAPVWSIALINLGFISMAVEELRSGSRYMVIFPILWFGGYVIAAGLSHWQCRQLNIEIQNLNAGKLIPFDQTKDDVLITPNNSGRYASPLNANVLVMLFGVDRAYQVTEPDRKSQKIALHKSGCPGGGVNYRSGVTVQTPTDGGYSTDRLMMHARGLCIHSSFAEPSRRIVRVTLHPLAKDQTFLGDFITQDIEIEGPNGKATLKSGWAVPLSWFPQPIIGCGLDGSTPKWKCFAEFAKQDLYHPLKDRIPNGADDVVARALGLTKASLRERYPDAAWRESGAR